MSTDEREIVLRTTVDSSAAQSGFEETSRAANKMAGDVAQAAIKTGKGIEGIGDGGDKAAQKLDKATSSIINSIQRTTATMEAGERGTAKYYESIANQRGANVDALRPYLAQLDAATAKQKAAIGSLDKMGISAGQTAAALRGVPAQFTDIFTSLQGGQNPMTVFLQQGGQLKDMFGGAGAAARAMGGYVLGLINPLTVAAAAGAALGVAYNQGANEAQAMAKALIITGNAAGTSVNNLKNLAASVATATGATQGAVAEALTQVVQSGKIAESSLGLVAAAAVKMNRATGQSVEDTIKQFEELAKSPVEASAKLNEQYNYLTASVYKQIKALSDQGKQTEAVALAQQALADAQADMANKVEQSLGTLERSWAGIAGTAKKAWDAMLDIGREASLEDKLAKARQALANGGFTLGGESEARAQVAVLEAQIEAQKKQNIAKSEGNALTKASIEWDKENEKYLSNQGEKKRAILTLDKQFAAMTKAALGDQKAMLELAGQYETRLKAINEKYADKKQEKSQALKDAEALNTLLDRITGRDSGLDASYWKDLERLNIEFRKRNLSEAEYVVLVEKLTTGQKFYKDSLKEEADALKERNKWLAEWEKFQDSETKAINNQVEKGREYLDNLGLTKSAQEELEASKYTLAAAAREEYAANLQNAAAYAGEFQQAYLDAATAAREQAKALGDLAVIKRQTSAKEIAVSEAKESARAWERFASDIERSLTDALFRGFESGKSFGENFIDSLKNSLKTSALKIVVNYVTSTGGQIVGSAGNSVINSIFGTASENNGAGRDYLGVASNTKSAYNLYTSASQAYTAISTGAGALPGTAALANAYGAVGGDTLGAFIQLNPQWTASVAEGASGATIATEAGAEAGAAAGASAWTSALSAAGAGLTAYGVGGYLGEKYGTTAGVVGGTLAGAGTYAAGAGIAAAAGGAGMAGGMAAASAALAAIPVWGWAALAIMAIAGSSGGFTRGPWEAEGPSRFAGTFNETNGGMTSGVTLQDFKQEGGWFHSDRSKTEATQINSAFDSLLDRMYQSTKSVYAAVGNLLGDTYLTDKLVGFSARIEVADMTNVNSAIESMGKQLADAMGRALLPSVDAINKATSGESWDQTFQRVISEVNAVNSMFALLGHTLNDQFGKNNADRVLKLADSLVTLMGGVQQMQDTMQRFYAGYYSQDERQDLEKAAMAEQFKSLGLVMPETRTQFRRLVESMDLATVSGQQTYASLLGMADAFGVMADSMANTIDETANAIETALAGLFDNLLLQIQGARTGVADARSTVSGIDVMSSAQIRAAIATASPVAPSGNTILQTQTALQQTIANSNARINTAIGARDTEQAAVNERNRGWAYKVADLPSVGGWAFNGGEQINEMWDIYNRLAAAGIANGFSGSSSYRNSSATFGALPAGYQFFLDGSPIGQSLQLNHWQDGISVNGQSWGRYNRDLDAYAYKPYGTEQINPWYDQNVATARTQGAAAITAAEKAAIQAQIDYTRAIQQYVLDAGKAVEKLNNLRDETIKYYKAQQELADTLMGSAGNLREAVRLSRESQMDEADLMSQRRQDFARAYSMALSTAGTVQAGYADKMAATLPSLVQMLEQQAGSRVEWERATGQLYAQSGNIASILEAAGAVDYQGESLAMLNAIDSTLAAIEAQASSAEKIISDAVYKTGATTAEGLRAVIAAIQGKTIPAFATGGFHAGGLRIVGENGPELEATGPARIFNAADTRAMFSGGNNDAVVTELRALREENALLRSAVEAVATHTYKTAKKLEEVVGDGVLVRTEAGAPLETVTA